MYLILSTPSIDYAKLVSHELWMLSRPRSYSGGEISQYYCGTLKHPGETKVAIGPITSDIHIHVYANVKDFVTLIEFAITDDERQLFSNVINSARSNKVNIVDIVTGAAPSLIDNFRTKEEMEAEGWFEQPVEEVEVEEEEVIEV